MTPLHRVSISVSSLPRRLIALPVLVVVLLVWGVSPAESLVGIHPSNRGNNNNVNIIACSSSIELDRAISIVCQSGDTVLEFGAQLSETSRHIQHVIGPQGTVVHVTVQEKQDKDAGKHRAKSGRNKHRNTLTISDNNTKEESTTATATTTASATSKILKLPALEDWKHHLGPNNQNKDDVEQNSDYDYNVIIIDLGHLIGNDLVMTTLDFSQDLVAHVTAAAAAATPSIHQTDKHDEVDPKNDIDKQRHNTPKSTATVLIKSKSLSSLARRMIPFQHLLDGTATLPQATKQEDEDEEANDNDHDGINNDNNNTINAGRPSWINSNEPFIIPCVGVSEYRRTIPWVVQEGDSVVELGCFNGRTTALLYDHAVAAATASTKGTKNNNNKRQRRGFCIGVDIGPKIIQTAQKLHPHVPFAVGDAWKTLELLKLKLKYNVDVDDDDDDAGDIDAIKEDLILQLGYDVVYADIGGLSGAYGDLDSLALLDSIANAFEPKCIVIKSLCMRRLATKVRAFSDLWNKQQSSTTKEQQQQT